jgi:hypothetical protein
MSISEIKNRNFQTPLNFNFNVDRLPDFNYFVQRVVLPPLALSPATNGGTNPFVRISWPGDHMKFGDLMVEFKVDEEMRNWYEIFSWMQALTFPEKQSQYGAIYRGELKNLDGEPAQPPTGRTGTGKVFGQANLIINTSHNNPHLSINFVDLHPISLSQVDFDSRNTERTFVESIVTFRYDYFTVEKL